MAGHNYSNNRVAGHLCHLRKRALRPTMIFETIRGARLGDALRGWCHRNTRVSDYNETVIPGDNRNLGTTRGLRNPVPRLNGCTMHNADA